MAEAGGTLALFVLQINHRIDLAESCSLDLRSYIFFFRFLFELITVYVLAVFTYHGILSENQTWKTKPKQTSTITQDAGFAV